MFSACTETLTAGKELRILSPHAAFAAVRVGLVFRLLQHAEASRTRRVEVLHPQRPKSPLTPCPGSRGLPRAL